MSMETPTDWTIWLKKQQRLVILFLSRLILVLGLIGLTMTLERVLRERSVNFNTVYYFLAYVLLLLLFLIRKIPDTWRSLGFLLLLYLFGSVALYIGWLAGSGRLFLLTMIVVSVVLLGTRAGLYSAGLCFLTYVFFGLAFSRGWLKLGVLPDPTTPVPVIFEGLGFAINILTVGGGLWFFGKALMAADRSNREILEARAALDAKTRELEQANELLARQSLQTIQQSESRMRALLEAIPDMIFEMDREGTILHFVPSSTMKPLLPPEEFIGKKISDIMPFDVAEQTLFNIQRTLETGMLQVFQYKIMDREDCKFYEASVIKSDAERVIAMVRDITVRKWAETEREEFISMLERQKTELEQRNAELTQFAYTVSHDLKSPLVTINGYLGYIEQDAASGNLERLKADTRRIREAVNKMHTLLTELLELSRIGRMMNEFEDIPFHELVKDSLDIVHGQLLARHVTVQTQPNLPLVHGDRQRLTEVLQNLLDNAVKYMGDQSAPLIEIGQSGEEDGKPVFFIRDNGMGIAPEYHERIFGLFNKLDAKSEGTGVGLALVKRIIEFHGGRIWVQSEPQKGSTFYFTLPVKGP
ncbi:MAG: PAS domain S-box protein [Chloroflexi bacterium]|nr:PAS domain S-box protein [Chloroflexota bacterium]